MLTPGMMPRLQRADVLDTEGEKIGTVGEVWLEEGSHAPSWVSVRTGLFGVKESFVPLTGAQAGRDGLHVTVRKDQVADAPQVSGDGRLSLDQERTLYEHYGLPHPRQAEPPTSGTDAGTEDQPVRGQVRRERLGIGREGKPRTGR